MADLAALAEARSLLDLATDLMRRIDAEIAAAEAIRRRAEESLERVLAAGEAAGEHIGYLESELRHGRRRQEAAVTSLAEAAEAGRVFWEAALPGISGLPVLAASAHIPAAGPRTFVPDPPRLTAPTAEKLRRTPLPGLSKTEVWDLFAAEVSTFQDVFEKTLAELAEAEAAVETKKTRRERRKREAPAETEKARRT